MAGPFRKILDDWHLHKVRDRWKTATDQLDHMEAFDLHTLRKEARGLRQQLDRLVLAAEARLALPPGKAGLPRMPLGTDWAWRHDLWRAPLVVPGTVATEKRTPLAEDLALYHDCPLGEIVVRQFRNSSEDDRAPYGMSLDILGFRGSFVSLATNVPDDAIAGLKARHLIRLDAIIESDRPLKAFARLNIKHGPNVAQLVSDLPTDGRVKLAEFDLAYAKFDESRIERAWLDLIFNDPGLSRILMRDLVISRRPRAEA